MKATMITKVAEAQGTRSCWQEVFSGTYHEYEQFEAVEVVEPPKPGKGMAGLEGALGIIQGETINEGDEVLKEMLQLIIDKNVPQESRDKWCKKFSVNVVDDIPADGMKAIIKHLKKE